MCVETMHACDFLRQGFHFDVSTPDLFVSTDGYIVYLVNIILKTSISFYFERFELFANSIFLFEIIVSIIANINELNNLLRFLFIFDVLRNGFASTKLLY